MRSSPSTEQDRGKDDVKKREAEQELEVKSFEMHLLCCNKNLSLQVFICSVYILLILGIQIFSQFKKVNMLSQLFIFKNEDWRLRLNYRGSLSTASLEKSVPWYWIGAQQSVTYQQ